MLGFKAFAGEITLLSDSMFSTYSAFCGKKKNAVKVTHSTRNKRGLSDKEFILIYAKNK